MYLYLRGSVVQRVTRTTTPLKVTGPSPDALCMMVHEERVLTGTLNKREGGEDAVATAMSKTAIPLSPNEAKPHRWAGCGGLRIKRHVAAEKPLKPLKHWASPHPMEPPNAFFFVVQH